MSFDFSKNAFSQFLVLNKSVPKLSRSVNFNENSDYANHAGKLKHCYLVFEGDYAEKLYFGQNFFHAKDCMDFLGINYCENCYEIIDCE